MEWSQHSSAGLTIACRLYSNVQELIPTFSTSGAHLPHCAVQECQRGLRADLQGTAQPLVATLRRPASVWRQGVACFLGLALGLVFPLIVLSSYARAMLFFDGCRRSISRAATASLTARHLSYYAAAPSSGAVLTACPGYQFGVGRVSMCSIMHLTGRGLWKMMIRSLRIRCE